MNSVLWAVIGVGALVMIAVPLVVRVVGRVAVESARSNPALAGARVLSPSLYGGGQGPGVPMVRGTGVLGIVGDTVVFALAVPSRTIQVPIVSLTAVSVERALRLRGVYRRNRRRWLVLRWRGDAGAESAAGFIVDDPDRWAFELSRPSSAGRMGGPGPAR